MNDEDKTTATITMPAPTAWPMVLATGIALTATGLATSLMVSVAGVAIVLLALGAWMALLAPGCGEMEEPRVPPEQRAAEVVRSTRRIAAPRGGLPAHRSHYPERVHPYSAGAVGGLLGGGVMAAVAILYGIVSGRGVWYPINMLSGIILTRFDVASTPAELGQFDAISLIVASLLHLTVSVLVGLFFGILLPTLPKSPLFWGGVVAPLLWTGWIYGLMDVLNPVMNRLVDWRWFVASQFAYGLTLGWFVMRAEKVAATRVEGGPSGGAPS